MFLDRTVFEKNPIISCKKFNVARFVVINNFDIWDLTMIYFSEFSHHLEFFYEVYRKVIISTKFNLPRSHSIWEKSNPNLQKIQCCKNFNKELWHLTKLFFSESSHHQKTCMKYIEKSIFPPNFTFLGHRVFVKVAMLTCKNSMFKELR